MGRLLTPQDEHPHELHAPPQLQELQEQGPILMVFEFGLGGKALRSLVFVCLFGRRVNTDVSLKVSLRTLHAMARLELLYIPT